MMLSPSGGFALGVTISGPILGAALAIVLRVCDSSLPYSLNVVIFFVVDTTFSSFAVKKTVPFQSGIRRHSFRYLRWCAATAVSARLMPASGELTILVGNYMVLSLLWRNWVESIRSDGPQGRELAAYTFSRNLALFYVGTILLLPNAPQCLYVVGQMARTIMVPAICLLIMLRILMVWDMIKYPRKLIHASRRIWIHALLTLLYLLDKFDAFEAKLLYYLPKLILRPCEWMERVWVSVKGIPRYKYKDERLGSRQIRLLRLERRGIFSGMIRAQLDLYHVDNLPSYEALSYRWENENLQLMLVDGKLFPTTISAHELLLARSSIWRPRLVWIDAICIDQEDEVEKSNQVRLMREIYRSASRVIVWLGQSHDARLASSMLLHIFGTSMRTGSSAIALKAQPFESQFSTRRSALLKLFRKSYFERVWVVQEVAVASNVQLYHGGFYIPWQVLMRVIIDCARIDNRAFFAFIDEIGTVATNCPSFDNIAIMAVLNKISQFQSSRTPNLPDLGIVLSLCLRFKSCKPQDKVFALLGLVSDRVKEHPLLVVDYQKPIGEVFRDTAEYILSHCEKPLIILHYAGVGYFDSSEDTPSWAPCWKGDEFIGYHLINPSSDYDKLRKYDAAKALKPVIQFNSKHTLLLKGTILDTMSAVTSALVYTVDAKHTSSLFEVIKAKYNWHEEAYRLAKKKSPNPYLNGQPRDEAFWRTLIGDGSITGRALPHFADYYMFWVTHLARAFTAPDYTAPDFTAPDLAALQKHIQRGIEQESSKYKYLTDPRFDNGIQDYDEALNSTSCGRRFGVTELGYMGLVPPKAEVGDLLCVVWGAETPFLIRRCCSDGDSDETSEPVYQLVGECYIHGMMNGEVLERISIKSEMIRLV